MLILIRAAALLCILYGLTVLRLIGPGRLFNFFYLLLGIVLLLFSFFITQFDAHTAQIMIIILLLGLIIFLISEALIISYSLRKCEKDADYLIVLGSQVKVNGPSMDYKARLDSANEYLLANPSTKVICTGGQGKDEPVSEAESGASYLLRRGITADRIIKEDKSTNTFENIANAKELITREMDPSAARIVIVSADYHLCRASLIAHRLKLNNVSLKGARGLFILLPHYYSREFFALTKELLLPSK